MRFNDGLQSLGASEAVRAIGLLDRCLQTAGESTNQQALLDQLLPELVTEFSAQWCGVLVRNPGWELQVDYGRQRPASWPSALLEESLDKGAAGGESIAEPEGWTAAAVPLDDSAPSASVLLRYHTSNGRLSSLTKITMVFLIFLLLMAICRKILVCFRMKIIRSRTCFFGTRKGRNMLIFRLGPG